MTITRFDVRKVAAHVEEVTDGQLGNIVTGADVGQGSRIIDNSIGGPNVFNGRSAVRRAMAHYMAMALTIARYTGTEMPEEFVKYREAMATRGLLDGHPDFESGKERALSYLRGKGVDVS